MTFDPVIPLLGLRENHGEGQDPCRKMFITALFIKAKLDATQRFVDRGDGK